MCLFICTHTVLHTCTPAHRGMCETEADIKDDPVMKRTRKPPGVVTTLTTGGNARISSLGSRLGASLQMPLSYEQTPTVGVTHCTVPKYTLLHVYYPYSFVRS